MRALIFVIFFALNFKVLSQNVPESAESKVKKFYAISLNIGSHAFHNPMVDETSRFYQPHYYNANVLYKFTPQFGLRAGAHFHNFKMENKPSVKYANLSLDAFLDLNQIGTFGHVEDKFEFSVLSYVGVGVASMWRDRSATTMNDPYFKGNDDMFTLALGITPRLRVGKNLFFNFDISYLSHVFLSRSFDFTQNYERRGFGGSFFRYSIGLTYEFR